MNLLARLSSPRMIVAGYAAAPLLGALAVYVWSSVFAGPDREASSGMAAFGDSLLFLFVAAIAAVPPTCGLLHRLRPMAAFWRYATMAAIAMATTGLGALAHYLLPHGRGIELEPSAWALTSPLRILLAPLFGLVFLLAALFAPDRGQRALLFGALAAEALTFGGGMLIWMLPLR